MTNPIPTPFEIEQLKVIVWPIFAAAFIVSGKVHPEDIPKHADAMAKAFAERLPNGQP